MANKAVNDFILAMNYDKKKLLTHQGESIENRFIKEGNQSYPMSLLLSKERSGACRQIQVIFL